MEPELETCMYVEPMLLPKELTKGKDVWIDYASYVQSPALPDRVRVLIGGGGRFDAIGNLCGTLDSWDGMYQLAAEIANNWYDRGNG